MGGEPLCKENLPLTALLVEAVRTKFPNIKIYVWTGYVYEELLKDNDTQLKNIISQINCLIDGPYIESERDVTLKMRGSRNQRIIDL
jgi:anaerobic ribonucleoside-triphosphate reductase activating protein